MTERFGWQPIPKPGINVSGDREAWLQHNYVRQLAAAIGLTAMLIQRIDIKPPSDAAEGWPYTVPAIEQITAEGLRLTNPLTFLVGENGSGKSTLMEAIAEAWGDRSARGKRQEAPPSRARHPGRRDRPRLHGRRGSDARGKGRSSSYFLRAESALRLLEYVSSFGTIVPGYPQEDLRYLSHGEGYLGLFREVFSRPGLYLMDEPESELSFMSSLDLVLALHERSANGAQVLCATHSPIIASTPGAAVLELNGDGIRPAAWEDLELVAHWRKYLNHPQAYLRHLIE